jgi:hypothetical protein
MDGFANVAVLRDQPTPSMLRPTRRFPPAANSISMTPEAANLDPVRSGNGDDDAVDSACVVTHHWPESASLTKLLTAAQQLGAMDR